MMNFACSSCMELFTSRTNICTIPCGHVFHTNCIKSWLQTGQSNCPQCRKDCTQNQIIKLYFEEKEMENELIIESEEKTQKMKPEENETKSKCLKLKDEELNLKAMFFKNNVFKPVNVHFCELSINFNTTGSPCNSRILGEMKIHELQNLKLQGPKY